MIVPVFVSAREAIWNLSNDVVPLNFGSGPLSVAPLSNMLHHKNPVVQTIGAKWLRTPQTLLATR